MLQAQVNYWNLQETKQHNRATEAQAYRELVETNRHNLATEKAQAQQAKAALKQAAVAAKNAATNLFIAKYNKDLGYKNLAVNQKNADSNAKQALAALQNAQSNALQAQASWKNALTNAYAASETAKYQQNMAAVSKYRALIENDRNQWQKEAQSIKNLTEWNTQSKINAETTKVRAETNKIREEANSYQYLNELRKQQAVTEQFEQAGTVAELMRNISKSGSDWVDAFIPF